MEQVYRRKKNILKAELEQAPSGQARDEISLGMEHLGAHFEAGTTDKLWGTRAVCPGEEVGTRVALGGGQ